jgi:CobQ-like glutamine amidotransferase family enzyme
MSILSAIRQQSSSIDDLAKLPQAMIMQMAQKNQIAKEMLAPILARKAELADAFARQNALQNVNKAQPTVIEQIMAKNAQSEQPKMPEQESAGISELPIPDREYAGGGIIAFEEGGDVEEEDLEYEMARDDRDMNIGSSIDEIYNLARYGSRDTPVERPSSEDEPDRSYKAYEGSGVRYREPVPAGASKGIEPRKESTEEGLARLRAAIMQKESGGRRYDKEGRLLTSPKGAEGEMQVMPATARDPGFGIKPARNNSPDELRRVGDEYVAALLNRYRDPTLVMIAYNMGPGATDKWLVAGADPRKLPKETQNYIKNVSLAAGGEVKRFQYGGLNSEFGLSESNDEMDELRLEELKKAKQLREAQDKNEFLREAAPQLVDKSIPERAAPKVAAKEETPKDKKETPDLQKTFEDFVRQQQANPERSVFEDRIARNQEQREEIKKSAAEDRNLALLAAGLGILGGSSRNASVNIGQGALKGVEFLGASKARRASELNALSNAELKAMYYGEENKRKERALTEGLADKRLGAVKDFEEKLRREMSAAFPLGGPKFEEAFRKRLNEDPTYARLMQNAGIPTAAPTKSTTIDFRKI